MKYFLLLISIALFSCNSDSGMSRSNVSTTSSPGEQLFKANCATCHKCEVDFTGPAMSGALSRWKSKELLYEYIRNPASVIEKDQYARELQNKFKVIMTAFPQLSDADIDAILNYCH